MRHDTDERGGVAIGQTDMSDRVVQNHGTAASPLGKSLATPGGKCQTAAHFFVGAVTPGAHEAGGPS